MQSEFLVRSPIVDALILFERCREYETVPVVMKIRDVRLAKGRGPVRNANAFPQ